MLKHEPRGLSPILTNEIACRPTVNRDNRSQTASVLPVHFFHARVVAALRQPPLDLKLTANPQIFGLHFEQSTSEFFIHR